MKLKSLIQQIEHAIPPVWALPNDPVGLHLGDRGQDVTRAYVALEASAALLKTVVKRKCQLLFVHHPLIYRPLKRVTESDPVQSLVRELIRRDIALYAAHTNMDLHPQGMAPLWARRLGCAAVEPLAPKPQASQLKLVTFAPAGAVASLRDAMANAGAGFIGEYHHCSFETPGTGSFHGSEQSNPTRGQAGRLEHVDEIRLEMILPASRKLAVVDALQRAHPYDEAAYDLYPLEDVRDISQAMWIAEFKPALSWKAFEARLQRSTPLKPNIAGVRPRPKAKIKRAAILTGSGGSVIPMACSLGVDVFLTGEAGYHELWHANEVGLNVATVGHDVSESLFAEAAAGIVKPHAPDVKWVCEYGT